MFRKLIPAVGGTAIGFAAWWFGTQVPELEGAIRIRNAYALADGGTVGLELLDDRNTSVRVTLRGSLSTPSEGFPCAIVRTHWQVPITRTLSRASDDEAKISALLQRAARDTSPHESAEAQFAQRIAAELQNRRATIKHGAT